MRRVKVLFFVPSFAGGGAERVMSILINKFDRKIFHIIVVTLQKSQFSYSVCADQLFVLKSNRVLFSGLELLRLIKSHRPQFVFTTLTYVNTYVGLLDYFFRFNTVLIARESTIPSINNHQRRLGYIYDLFLRAAYKRFSLIICQSISMKFDLADKFGIAESKLHVINNPVNPPVVSSSRPLNDTPAFVTVSMLRREKGIDRILDALALVKFDFKYFIVGDGTEGPSLKQRVKRLGLTDKVHFVGFSSTPEEYLRVAHVYLHGSLYEGFPNVILEAGVVGLPVLSFTSFGGTEEIIKNGLNGLIVANKTEYTHALNARFWDGMDNERIQHHTLTHYGSEVITRSYQDIFLKKFDTLCAE
jgi:glycosyltransferase involved in cell wall biosynthesis